METPRRKGARRQADISPELLDRLERGRESSASLVEWLAIDQARLLGHVLEGSTLWGADEAAETLERARAAAELGIVQRTRTIGEALGEATVDHPARRAELAAHPSDAVRCWAAYAVQVDVGDLAQRFESARPYAADPHSGVREIAWLAVREPLIEELEASIGLLEPWVAESDANLRRFAVEATRPRGVWCPHVPRLKQEPQLALPLLEPLRADPARYVQDSVANWLNDASKHQPDWVRDLCARWTASGDERATARIARRALRTLDRS